MFQERAHPMFLNMQREKVDHGFDLHKSIPGCPRTGRSRQREREREREREMNKSDKTKKNKRHLGMDRKR